MLIRASSAILRNMGKYIMPGCIRNCLSGTVYPRITNKKTTCMFYMKTWIFFDWRNSIFVEDVQQDAYLYVLFNIPPTWFARSKTAIASDINTQYNLMLVFQMSYNLTLINGTRWRYVSG